MIGGFCELARRGDDARIICDIDLQKGRFPALLPNLIHSLETCFAIPRTDEHMKPLFCKLTCNLVANPLIRSRDQCRLHAR